MSFEVKAPMVGKLVSVDVNVGDQIKENDPVATIEAMKMFVKVYSPGNGAVTEIKATAGEVINPDTVIMLLK